MFHEEMCELTSTQFLYELNMEGSSLPAASAWADTVRSWKRTCTDGSSIPTLRGKSHL